jgi:hypothetical protein
LFLFRNKQIVDTVNKEDPELDRSSRRRRRRRRNTCKIPKRGVEINGGFPGRWENSREFRFDTCERTVAFHNVSGDVLASGKQEEEGLLKVTQWMPCVSLASVTGKIGPGPVRANIVQTSSVMTDHFDQMAKIRAPIRTY